MLPEPSVEYAQRRILDFDAEPQYCMADQTVGLVFHHWPLNTDLAEVLAKVVVLNRLYSTNIWDVHAVAEHILTLNIDVRLERGDIEVVDELASAPRRSILSFASKYCSWHRPEYFQIFDSYVEEVLWYYRKRYRFAEFKRQELRHYAKFMDVVDSLVKHFGLESLSRKDLDKFLWLEGRVLKDNVGA